MANTDTLRQAFEQALELEGEARTRFLQSCTLSHAQRMRLERMLQADSMGDAALQALRPDHLVRAIDPDSLPTIQPGQSIGAYHLQRVLGEGGSSTVFLAERELAGEKELVALKLLHRGLYTEEALRHFRQERHLLGLLQHAQIARLIDGGVTGSGAPYLVTEFVDGQPITEYADRNRLDIRQRLDLMVRVARTVAAAHRSLVVHRDLKPSNILVTQGGSVKLLDFGVAKLLADPMATQPERTRTGFAALTVAYAAPEQLAGEPISTAADVYALGVLLYELLLGALPGRPYEGRASSQVRNLPTGAVPAGRLRAALRGDLDNILAMALAERPDHRYAGAAELAADLERHLASLPVLAHPPSWRYRAGKFLDRHRVAAIATLALTLGLLITLLFALGQASIAREQARRAAVVTDFMVNLFDSARASLPRDLRPTPEALIGQARRRLLDNPDLDAATQLALQRTLAEVWLSLSAFEEADTALRKALALAEQLEVPDSLQEIKVLQADAWQRTGRNAEAEAAIEAMLPQLRRQHAPVLPDALTVLASAKEALGHPLEAVQYQREGLDIARQLDGADSLPAQAAELRLGVQLTQAQVFQEAADLLMPALERWKAGNAPEDFRYVQALNALAVARDGLDDPAGSEARLRELLQLKRKIYPTPHDAIASTLRDLAVVVARNGGAEESFDLFRQARDMQVAVFGEDHREVAATYDAWGVVLAGQRRFDEAEAQYRAAIAICQRTGLREEVCPRAHNNLGMTWYRQLRLDEAEEQMELALQQRRELFGNDHATVAYSLSTLANVATRRGDAARGVALSQESLDILENLGRGGSTEATLIRHGLAQALHQAGQADAALQVIRQAIEDWRRLVPDGTARLVSMLVERAQIERLRSDTAAVTATLAEIDGLSIPAEQLPAKTLELIDQLRTPP